VDTTLTASFVPSVSGVLTVASTAYMVANMYLYLGADVVTHYEIYSVDSPTQVTIRLPAAVVAAGTVASGTRAYCPFFGSGGINVLGDASGPSAHAMIVNNRVGQATIGKTLYGLNFGNGAVGPFIVTGNDFSGCLSGDVRTVTGQSLYLDNPTPGSGGTGVKVGSATFTETTGAGAYTAGIPLPAGSTIMDIKVRSTAVWSDTGTVNMDVGDDDDPDGWFTQIDLKAAGDLLVGEEINFVQTGSTEGAYLNLTTGRRLRAYLPAAKTITGKITSTGGGGTQTGRTRMLVEYVTTAPFAATKA
jgi:hypothetical protein